MNERRDWIEDNTNIFINKFLNKEELEEEEIRLIVYQAYNHKLLTNVATEVIDRTRWYEETQIVLQVQETGKYYAIYYLEGLTETQESEFESQVAQEVEPIPVKKIEWREVK